MTPRRTKRRNRRTWDSRMPRAAMPRRSSTTAGMSRAKAESSSFGSRTIRVRRVEKRRRISRVLTTMPITTMIPSTRMTMMRTVATIPIADGRSDARPRAPMMEMAMGMAMGKFRPVLGVRMRPTTIPSPPIVGSWILPTTRETAKTSPPSAFPSSVRNGVPASASTTRLDRTTPPPSAGWPTPSCPPSFATPPSETSSGWPASASPTPTCTVVSTRLATPPSPRTFAVTSAACTPMTTSTVPPAPPTPSSSTAQACPTPTPALTPSSPSRRMARS
mmetsp:Transcript_22638/g.65164  ORF Transcript_22638/g.65164 Transcript_22638/m.65164 type:complete len:276 (+) Transcript_22638:191-1018(+)